MKSICKVFIGLLAFGVITCQAIPLDISDEKTIEDNEIVREERQVKGMASQPGASSSPSVGAEQAEVKVFGGQMYGTMGAGAVQAFLAANNNLQAGRLPGFGNAFMLQSPYGGLGYGGLNTGLGLNGQINGLPSGFINPNGNIHLSTQPNGLEFYPQYMNGGNLLSNAGGSLGTNIASMPTMNPFEQSNFQGLSTQLVAQQSQLQPQQIAPYPFMQGSYYQPQLGFNPGYQAYQG